MDDASSDQELIEFAKMWTRPHFLVVVESNRAYISPNFYFYRAEDGSIRRGDRRLDEIIESTERSNK
jgi:hypothetical protein